MKLKNRELIGRLLTSVIIENRSTISLRELEGYLDELFRQRIVYPSFEDRVVHWNLEDGEEEKHQKSFHQTLSQLNALQSNRYTVEFDVKCDQCGNDLVKESGTKFRCEQCRVTHEFRLMIDTITDGLEDDRLNLR